MSIFERQERSSLKIQLGLRELLIGVVVAGFFNAEFIRLSRQIARDGIIEQIYATFGINLVVWCAFFSILRVLNTIDNPPLSKLDGLILGAATAAFLSPVTAFSAIGLSGVGAFYSIYGKSHDLRRAMRLLFTLTVTLMWGRFTFSFLLPYILKADTALVTSLTGLESFSNIIVASDHKTFLQVGAGCSSFLNLTTAVLGWFTAILYFDVKANARRVVLLIISCVAVILINTVRIGMIGWMPDHYELIHGPVGSNIVNLIESASILYFSMLAVKN